MNLLQMHFDITHVGGDFYVATSYGKGGVVRLQVIEQINWITVTGSLKDLRKRLGFMNLHDVCSRIEAQPADSHYRFMYPTADVNENAVYVVKSGLTTKVLVGLGRSPMTVMKVSQANAWLTGRKLPAAWETIEKARKRASR